jgi:hypothetical protein
MQSRVLRKVLAALNMPDSNIHIQRARERRKVVGAKQVPKREPGGLEGEIQTRITLSLWKGMNNEIETTHVALAIHDFGHGGPTP